MAYVQLRRFAVTPPRRRKVDARDIKLTSRARVEISLAASIRQNALAVRYRGRLLTRLVQRELALVLSLYQHSPVGRPLLRHAAFPDSSLHIRRLATEVAALGCLTSCVENSRGPIASLAHFDGLPTSLQSFYSGAGTSRTRPDLRFTFGSSVLAGESRGRDAGPPVRVQTTAEQRSRLDELIAWGQQNGDDICMAWSWIQPSGTTVDLFELHSPAPAPRSHRELRRMRRARNDLRRRVTGTPEDVASETDQGAGQESLRAEIIDLTQRDVESEYAETAVQLPVPGLPAEWLGEWVEIPRPDDLGAAGHLLMAVNVADEVDRTSAARERWRTAASEDALDMDASGRLLVAIDWAGRDLEESGRQIADRLS